MAEREVVLHAMIGVWQHLKIMYPIIVSFVLSLSKHRQPFDKLRANGGDMYF
jgi:hypothetical protein